MDECFAGAGIYANGKFYEDDFVRVEVSDHHRLMDLVRKSGEKGFCRYLNENDILPLHLSYNPSEITTDKYYGRFRSIFHTLAHKTSFKSAFFKNLIDTCLDYGWVNIEQNYIKALMHHKREDGSTDFFDKTITLGTHFTDKGRMRKLVVNFNEADAIPQMKK